MKKFLLVLTVLVSVTAMSQKTTAPVAVKSAFTKAYPAATKVKYEKEDGQYEVTFVDKGNEMSVIYNANGVLQESEHEMKISSLPPAAAAYMKEHYKGIPVKGAAKITKTDGSINFEAAIKGKDVIFDSNGKFIREMKN